MLKAILAGTTALTLLGGSVVLAQQTTPAQQPGNTITQMHVRMTPEEIITRTNARVTELKTELKLTPQQEKNWSLFEVAVRDSAKQRAEHFKMREQAGGQPQGDRTAASSEETANQKRLAAALDPLYKSLDEGQKAKFATMFRVDGEGRHYWFKRGGEHRDQKS